MKKVKGLSFDELLKKELKNKEIKFLFDERQFYLQVAHLISELRAKSGLSQVELAKKAGVSQPLVARLEKGDHRRTPTFDTIFKILKALGYSLELSIKPERKVAA
jgi:HTH-type transcriptional regulator/antitoxin HipB